MVKTTVLTQNFGGVPSFFNVDETKRSNTVLGTVINQPGPPRRTLAIYQDFGGVPSFYNPDGVKRSTNIMGSLLNTAAGITPPMSTGATGTLAAFETVDAFAATGTAAQPVDGTFVTTDLPDAFSAFGTAPETGVLAATEYPDEYRSTYGFAPLNITHVQEVGNTSLTTDVIDSVVFLFFASQTVGGGGPESFIESISVTDHPEVVWQLWQNVVGEEPYHQTGTVNSIWWAYVPEPVDNKTMTINIVGGGTTTVTNMVVVEGINGSWQSPWEGDNALANNGVANPNTPDGSPALVTSNPFNLSTGPNGATEEVPYHTITFAFLTGQDLGETAVPPGVPAGFTQLSAQHVTGSQRQISTNLSYLHLVNNVLASPPFYVQTPNDAYAWTMNYATIVLYPPPGVFITAETPDTMSVFGTLNALPPSGSLTSTEAADTFTAVGYQPASGTLFTGDATDTFSAFGFQPLHGVLAANDNPDTFHGTGIGLGEDGTWVSAEAVDTLAASGYTPVSGTFVVTETPDQFRAFAPGVSPSTGRRRRLVYVV